MMPLSHLAQIRMPEVKADDFFTFLGCVVLVLLIWALVLNIRGQMKKKEAGPVSVEGQPLQVMEVDALATKKEVEAMVRRFETDIAELKHDMETDRAAVKDDVVALHKRLDPIATNTAAIKGQLEQISANQALIMQQVLSKK
jgi:hypothetical protein